MEKYIGKSLIYGVIGLLTILSTIQSLWWTPLNNKIEQPNHKQVNFKTNSLSLDTKQMLTVTIQITGMAADRQDSSNHGKLKGMSSLVCVKMVKLRDCQLKLWHHSYAECQQF